MEKIRASSVDRLLNCNHAQMLPGRNTKDSFNIAGDEQHQIAHNMLQGLTDKREVEDNTFVYVNYIYTRIRDNTTPVIWGAEEQLEWEWLRGKPDCYLYYPEERVIEIVDLKNGYQEVMPTSNQLKTYAYILHKRYPEANKFKLTIIQHSEITTITVTLDDLNILINTLIENNDKHIWKTGKHCRYCPGKIHCKKMYELTTLDASNTDAMIKLVQNKSNIENTLKEAQTYLLEKRKDWFIVKTRNYKHWIDEAKAPTTTKIIAPAAALKLDKTYKDNIKEIPSYTYKIKGDIQDDRT